ncbi:MAG: DUF3830 family protein [Candidatus Bathyarchaeota archaeon]|jgi:hypothetical protein
MSKRIKITIGGISFVARLLEDETPQTCMAFLEALPLEGDVIQARWSGEAVWFPMDKWGIEVPLENHTSHPSRGDLLYYPGGISEKELLIPYGSALFSSRVGQLQGNHFASIVEGAEGLGEMGRRALWEGAQRIIIQKE